MKSPVFHMDSGSDPALIRLFWFVLLDILLNFVFFGIIRTFCQERLELVNSLILHSRATIKYTQAEMRLGLSHGVESDGFIQMNDGFGSLFELKVGLAKKVMRIG